MGQDGIETRHRFLGTHFSLRRSALAVALHADQQWGSIASGFDRGLSAYCWPREALWAEIPPPLQAAYRKISRIPNPVVAMVGGQCEGCRVQLTTNELQVLRRGERFTCQNCNRILVLN